MTVLSLRPGCLLTGFILFWSPLPLMAQGDPGPVTCTERFLDSPGPLSTRGAEKRQYRELVRIIHETQETTLSTHALASHFVACCREMRLEAAEGKSEGESWPAILENLTSSMDTAGDRLTLDYSGDRRSFGADPAIRPWTLAGKTSQWLEKAVRSAGGDGAVARELIWFLWVESALSALDQRYNSYVYADELAAAHARHKGKTFGPGFFPTSRDGRLHITRILDDAITAAGVRVGSLLVEWDGRPAADWDTDEIRLYWLRPAPFEYSFLARTPEDEVRFHGRSVPHRDATISWAARNRIAYLRIDRFAEDTLLEFRRIARQFPAGDVEKLILDVRGNGGGASSLGLVDCFLKPGQTVSSYESVRGEPDRQDPEGTVEYYDYPLVVLLDGESASMSEILAAGLQQNGRATLIGERSSGKGVGQTIYPVHEEGEVHLVGTRYFYPGTDRTWHETGIQPDIQVESTDDDRKRLAEALSTPVIDLSSQMQWDLALQRAFAFLESSP